MVDCTVYWTITAIQANQMPYPIGSMLAARINDDRNKPETVHSVLVKCNWLSDYRLQNNGQIKWYQISFIFTSIHDLCSILVIITCSTQTKLVTTAFKRCIFLSSHFNSSILQYNFANRGCSVVLHPISARHCGFHTSSNRSRKAKSL